MVKMWKKNDLSYPWVGNISWYIHFKTIWQFLKKLNIHSQVFTQLKIKPYACTNTYAQRLTAWFTIVKNWKLSKCPSIGKWIFKMWFVHTMEFYTAIKINESLICTKINLKIIMNSTKPKIMHTIWAFIYIKA